MLASPDSDALAQADRLYAPLRDQSCEYATNQASLALEAYRAVSRRYPLNKASHLGAARCLFRMGRYDASVAEFRNAGSSPNDLATALRFAKTAKRVRQSLPGRQAVLHLVSLGGDRWAVVSGRWVHQEAPSFTVADLQVQSFRVTFQKVEPTGKAVMLNAGAGGAFEVSVFAPSKIRPAFVVQTTSLLANCLPNDAYLLTYEKGGLRRRGFLKGIGEARVWLRGNRPCFLMTPTYKVWWSDVYEWDGQRIVFANRRHPELYKLAQPTGEKRKSYAQWMRYAAALTIRGRHKEALAAWENAEVNCVRSLQDPNWYSHADWYGSDRRNLAEIRQRLAWLRRGDWGHALLYRPYDWDFQVPPFNLKSPSPY